jgi:hypothetical protein
MGRARQTESVLACITQPGRCIVLGKGTLALNSELEWVTICGPNGNIDCVGVDSQENSFTTARACGGASGQMLVPPSAC